MIQLGEEELISAPAVAKLAGVSAKTAWSWMRDGFRGIRLDSIQCGRHYKTTRTALDRFLEAIRMQTRQRSNPSPAVGESSLNEAHEAAKARLAARGIG